MLDLPQVLHSFAPQQPDSSSWLPMGQVADGQKVACSRNFANTGKVANDANASSRDLMVASLHSLVAPAVAQEGLPEVESPAPGSRGPMV